MPPTDLDERIVQSHIWVPMDDTHSINWMVTWHPDRKLTDEEIRLNIEGKGAHVCDYAPATSEPYGDVRTAANRDNDYFMDWEIHRTRMYCGIPGFGVQDQAVQESQGDIVDRSQERLGSSDTAIIQVRRRMMTAARALREHGTAAPGANPRSFLVRSASVVLAPGESWIAGGMPRMVGRAISSRSPDAGPHGRPRGARHRRRRRDRRGHRAAVRGGRGRGGAAGHRRVCGGSGGRVDPRRGARRARPGAHR
jgi:hypothetical protein